MRLRVQHKYNTTVVGAVVLRNACFDVVVVEVKTNAVEKSWHFGVELSIV